MCAGGRRQTVMLCTTLGEVVDSNIRRVAANVWCLLKENMRKVRVLLGILAVLVFVGSASGCGLVSDQTKQDAKNKVESKAQQVKQEAKKKVEEKARQAKKKVEAKGPQAKQEVKKKIEAGREDLKKKVEDLKKKVEAGQEDLKKKVASVQKDLELAPIGHGR
jgi:gas vesicle protein